jgi:hypothetical protein
LLVIGAVLVLVPNDVADPGASTLLALKVGCIVLV